MTQRYDVRTPARLYWRWYITPWGGTSHGTTYSETGTTSQQCKFKRTPKFTNDFKGLSNLYVREFSIN